MIRTRLQGDTPFFPNMLNNGKVEVCLKEDVDMVIGEKDAEIHRLKQALWLTRGAVHKAKRLAMYGILQAYPLWEGSPAGLEVHKNIHRYDGYEHKFLKKAEELK